MRIHIQNPPGEDLFAVTHELGGGLIQTMQEVEGLLAQGLSAVSTSNPEMWIK